MNYDNKKTETNQGERKKKPNLGWVSAFAPFITNFKNIVLPGQHHFAFTIAIM